MLTKTENEVMKTVYTLSGGKGQCLIALADVTSTHPKWSEERVQKVLEALALDGYFELLCSERKGEKMYLVTLRPKGLSFARDDAQRKRSILLKIGWAIVSAVIAFFATMLLGAIF